MLTHHIDDHLNLRLIDMRYADAVYQLLDANRPHLRPWFEWVDDTQSADDYRAFIKQSRQRFALGDRLPLIAFWDDQPIGSVGIRANHAHHTASIGYWLGAQWQGRGIMTRSCQFLIDWAVSAWDSQRIEIRAAAHNIRSRAIPERLGFTHEATLHHAHWLHGRPHDFVIYAHFPTHHS